jgi:hypothetical protein
LIPVSVISAFRPALWLGTALFLSGIFHLTLLWVTGAAWEGALSPRKPGLFGISAGMTVWSVAWLLTQLNAWRYDRGLASLFAASLFAEVALITLQYWRGVPSHFNHATPLDATIEAVMFVLIVFATLCVAVLCWRSNRLPAMDPGLKIAIRAGLWLLLISCGLGFVATVAGEMNVARGIPPEVWGHAGVLKYPHGAALHAIQVLPLLAWLLQWLRSRYAVWLLWAAVGSQVLFLEHALWQTASGRSRFDLDPAGLITLAASGALLVLLFAGINWSGVLLSWPQRPN